MPKTRTLLALVLLPILVFLVACGGDDDDDSNGGGGDQPAASDSSSSGSNGSSSATDGDDDDDSDGDIDANDVLANCPEFAGFATSVASAFAGASTGSAGDDIEETVQYFQALADGAPDEIKGDMQVIADAFSSFFAVLDEYGIDLANPASFATMDEATQAEFQAALEELGSPDVEQASENISNWFDENCQ